MSISIESFKDVLMGKFFRNQNRKEGKKEKIRVSRIGLKGLMLIREKRKG